MINVDYPDDLKQRLSEAIAGLFAGCRCQIEYATATSAIVEIFSALNFTSDEIEEVTRRADGMDADTDRCIDKIIEAFEE